MKAGNLKKILNQICKEYGDDIEVYMECEDDGEIAAACHVDAIDLAGNPFQEIRLTDDPTWLPEIYDGSVQKVNVTKIKI